MLFALGVVVLLVSSCGKPKSIDQLPDDTTNPAITYPFISMSSAEYFYPFGDTLHSVEASRAYFVEVGDTNLNVVSATDGIVTAISTNPDGNYTVVVRYKPNSIFTLEYSGVKTPVVTEGDSLNPGTILGKIARTGEMTFMVVKNGTEAICPATYGSTGFNTAVQLAINKHNTAHSNDSVFAACYAESLPR